MQALQDSEVCVEYSLNDFCVLNKIFFMLLLSRLKLIVTII